MDIGVIPAGRGAGFKEARVMKRRDFLTSTAAAGAAAALGAAEIGASSIPPPQTAFGLDFAPHFGMFQEHGGRDLMGQIQFMADQGFRSLEDNGMRGRSGGEQTRIAAEMGRRGMRMGVFVAHTIHWREPNLTSGDAGKREEFLAEIRDSVEVAQRVNATWMTVVPGHEDLRLHPDYQTAHVVESLKQASAILEPHGLVMVLEPLNPRDHPGLFLKAIPQAYQICKAVDSPACKILDDLYHQQVTEGNLIPNIDAAWDEIAYFQIGDNPGRDANVFRHIRDKGYRGVLGMEHGNSRPGRDGEVAVIEAYRSVDPG
jgi:hydroxypyruvate isomerase